MSEVQELPRGWVWTRLGDFTTIKGGSTPPRDEARYFGGKTIWLTPTEIPKETVTIIEKSRETLTEEGLKNSGVQLIPAGSVLLTSRASIGYVAIAGVPLTTNQGFASFVLPYHLNPKYIGWWLRSQKKNLEDLAGGTTFKEITKTTLKDFHIPFPPLSEQQRIVEALEQQLSRLDAGTAALRSVQKKLKRYRASVLKAAVEGKLTEEWRKSHSELEPASKLLTRILAERRAKWEEEQRAKGRDLEKVKYDEPEGPDVKRLPELPEGWCGATVEQVSYFVRYGTSAKTTNDPDGVPVLRMGNIQDGVLDTNNLKYLAHTHGEFPNLFLRKNDLLFNRTNSPELVGKSAVYKGVPSPCSYASYLISVRFVQDSLSDYLCFFLNSVYGRTWISSVVSQQVGQANVNGTKLLALTIPLPPLAEQEQIVSLVEERLSIISTLESTIEQVLKRAERMRQSILHKAFTGQLVPQDPNDEPASVLLEHIRQEREQAKPPQKLEHPTTRKPQVKNPGKRVAESTQPYLPMNIPDPQPLDTKTTTQSELWSYVDVEPHLQER